MSSRVPHGRHHRGACASLALAGALQLCVRSLEPVALAAPTEPADKRMSFSIADDHLAAGVAAGTLFDLAFSDAGELGLQRALEVETVQAEANGYYLMVTVRLSGRNISNIVRGLNAWRWAWPLVIEGDTRRVVARCLATSPGAAADPVVAVRGYGLRVPLKEGARIGETDLVHLVLAASEVPSFLRASGPGFVPEVECLSASTDGPMKAQDRDEEVEVLVTSVSPSAAYGSRGVVDLALVDAAMSPVWLEALPALHRTPGTKGAAYLDVWTTPAEARVLRAWIFDGKGVPWAFVHAGDQRRVVVRCREAPGERPITRVGVPGHELPVTSAQALGAQDLVDVLVRAADLPLLVNGAEVGHFPIVACLP